MINNVQIEICIGNIQDGLKAASYPVDRLELNCALELGGLSASLETLKYLKKKTDKKICCMLRPRGGDFCYSEEEFEVMMKDARNFLENKADGIVFGFLNENKEIDIQRTKKLTDLIHSYDKEAVFHKAFDELDDQIKGIEILIENKVDRILTSGKAVYPDILKGCKVINSLHQKYGDKIELLPGGGVRIENIFDVIKTSGVNQIHMTSKKQFPGNYLGLDEDQLKIMLEKIASIQ